MGKVIELDGKTSKAQTKLDLDEALANDGETIETLTSGAYAPEDAGNAQRFASQHQGRLLYCSAFGWLIWNGKRWVIDVKDEVMRLALQTAARFIEEVDSADTVEKKRAAFKRYAAAHRRERLRAMIDVSRHMFAVGVETFDRDEFLLNCKNGTVDLRTGGIKKPDPNDRITKLVNVAYDAKAKAPRFTKFLREIFKNDRELIAYMQRAIGYSLTARQNEECLFILQGDGRNGKTTFVQAILSMLGKDYADVARSELVMHQRFDNTCIDNAGLRGKRFISISETNAGKSLNEEVVKTITGREPLKGKLLYKDQFTFIPTHHIWLYSNYRPRIRGRDDGIWRRIRLIPFEAQFDDDTCDKTLADKLAAEREGILAWAVAGAVAWWNNGEPAIGTSDIVATATRTYREKEDTLKQYLDDRIVFDAKAEISASSLYENYKSWAEARRYFPWPMNTFGEYLNDFEIDGKKLESRRTMKGIFRVGMRFKTGAEPVAEPLRNDEKRKFER